MKVNAVYVVKNEWPLLAVSISHALTHYAEKVLIIDTGSRDGIFEGIQAMQKLWVGRIELFRCNQEIFDQTPLTNMLIEMSSEDQADWTMVLDADEFFVHDNYSEFLAKLSNTEEKWSSYSIPVENYIVEESHSDLILESFNDIQHRVVGESIYASTAQLYAARVSSGEIPLQYRNTPHKLLIRNSSNRFISQGNHQVVFGDGIWWKKYDSSISSGNFLGGKICHLPYTSENRLLARKGRDFFDQQETTFRLSVDEFKKASPSFLRNKAVLTPENREKWLQSGVVVPNNLLSSSLKPMLQKLESIWSALTLSTYNAEVENTFPDALNMTIVSKLIRKYHTRAEQFWKGGSIAE